MVRKYIVLLICACFLLVGGCDSPTAPSNEPEDIPVPIPEPNHMPDPEPTLVDFSIIGAMNIDGRDQEVQLRAEVTLSNGQILDKTREAEWRSSNLSVAQVNAIGLVTSVGYGTVNIFATYEDLNDRVNIKVQRISVALEAVSNSGAKFLINDRVIYHRGGGGGGGRGFNIAFVDPETGELIDQVYYFDTWLYHSERLRFINFLNHNVPYGVIVMVAVADEAGFNERAYPEVTEQVRRALKNLGSSLIDNYRWRSSWCMITKKGRRAMDENLGHYRYGIGWDTVTSAYTFTLP